MVSDRPSLFPGESPDLRDEAKGIIPDSEAWLDRPNLLLEGRKPSQLIGTTEESRVRNLIRALKHGFMS